MYNVLVCDDEKDIVSALKKGSLKNYKPGGYPAGSDG